MPSESEPAQLRALELACRRAGAGPGAATATVSPAAEVPGAAQTIWRGSGPPGVDLAELEAVGVRMPAGLEHETRDDQRIDRPARAAHGRVTFSISTPASVIARAELGERRQRILEVVLEPVEQDLHRRPPRTARGSARRPRREGEGQKKAVLEHRDAVEPQAESEARHSSGSDRRRSLWRRTGWMIPHPRISIQPEALALWDSREPPQKMHVIATSHPGLDEREERRDEPKVRRSPFSRTASSRKRSYRPLQVCHRDPRSTTSPSTWWNWASASRPADPSGRPGRAR